MKMPGRVFLVGAGPGDPDLLTVKAMRLISSADVIVFDRLVSNEVLALAGRQAKLIPVGKEPRRHPVPQEKINSILIAEARAGRNTIRLKGGDPFIFGRGSEEAVALREAGIPCEIVPGITAAQGCAASIGVPLTHRGLATGVRYITGHCRQDQPLEFDWAGLADKETTLVVYMGAANIAEIAGRLIEEGRSATTPVLAVNNGTTSRERRLVSDLEDVAGATARANFDGPVLFIIGDVVSLYPSRDICPVVRDAIALHRAEKEVAVHV
ncbi:MAG: uroporphyrin-III methyltransferase [Alphaproteobacteria bacterium BRH_c36]|nr:MAG: uroporphyrin-III methyltransferase [Alphaproteobacteria bacterium BRH_c36]